MEVYNIREKARFWHTFKQNYYTHWKKKKITRSDVLLEPEGLCSQKSFDWEISRIKCFITNPFKEKMEAKLRSIFNTYSRMTFFFHARNHDNKLKHLIEPCIIKKYIKCFHRVFIQQTANRSQVFTKVCLQMY